MRLVKPELLQVNGKQAGIESLLLATVGLGTERKESRSARTDACLLCTLDSRRVGVDAWKSYPHPQRWKREIWSDDLGQLSPSANGLVTGAVLNVIDASGTTGLGARGGRDVKASPNSPYAGGGGWS